MREELDLVLQQKVSTPSMDLYTPLAPYPSASSKLIQSIIDLIAAENYQWQVTEHSNCILIVICISTNQNNWFDHCKNVFYHSVNADQPILFGTEWLTLLFQNRAFRTRMYI